MECRLDFLSRDMWKHGDDPINQPDGNLVSEFYFMEVLYHRSTVDDLNHFACQVKQYPFMSCLDIGSIQTLAGIVPSLVTPLVTDLTVVQLQQQVANVSYITQFGQRNQCGDKQVSDGYIGIYDIATLIAFLFHDAPYQFTDSSGARLDPIAVETGLQALTMNQYATMCTKDMTTTRQNHALDTCYCGEGNFFTDCTQGGDQRRLEDAFVQPRALASPVVDQASPSTDMVAVPSRSPSRQLSLSSRELLSRASTSIQFRDRFGTNEVGYRMLPMQQDETRWSRTPDMRSSYAQVGEYLPENLVITDELSTGTWLTLTMQQVALRMEGTIMGVDMSKASNNGVMT